jgi:hypothetical protein
VRIFSFILLAALLLTDICAVPAAVAQAAPRSPREFEKADYERFGIRRLASKHVTLYTDLPSDAEVDSLPAVFDLAFPQWCRYFGQDAAKLAAWRMNAFVIKDKAKFEANGMLPSDLPDFPNGYARDNELWLYEQKSAYYRRHLFLHEGTHGFMFHVFGTCGPPWYMEGMAELLGTHKLKDGKLELLHFPQSRGEVPYLGRIKLVKEDVAKGRAMSLDAILAFDGGAHRRTEAYAWCWAATIFLASHPAYRDRFAELYKLLATDDFNRRVRAAYAEDWNNLAIEWREFVETIEYGHDIPRCLVRFAESAPVPATGTIVKLRCDAGWQQSGLKLEAGKTYRIRGKGRYQIAKTDKPWPAEPNGVTIRYWRGRPLGMLLGAVLDDKGEGLGEIIEIGLDHTFTARRSGALYLKVNDSPGELGDNLGTLLVHIVPAGS